MRAVESEAVERALDRIFAGPLIEEAVERAVSSPNVERALREALDSEMVDRLWEQLLASDEVQQLFEHIGEAPELRAAIASQGTGLLQDLGVGARRLARRADDLAESVIRRVLRRAPRSKPSAHAGLISRTLAFVLDASIINVGFLALSGLITFLVSTFTDVGAGEHRGSPGRHRAVAGRRSAVSRLLLGARGSNPGDALRRASTRVAEWAADRPEARASKAPGHRRGGRAPLPGPAGRCDQSRAPRLAGPNRADRCRLRGRQPRLTPPAYGMAVAKQSPHARTTTGDRQARLRRPVCRKRLGHDV